MPLDMPFEVRSRVARIIALCAIVRFFSTVNEDVPLQSTFLNKCLVTLRAIVLLNPTVDFLVVEKATATCE